MFDILKIKIKKKQTLLIIVVELVSVHTKKSIINNNSVF